MINLAGESYVNTKAAYALFPFFVKASTDKENKKSLSTTKNDCNDLCHLNVDKWKYMFYVSKIESSTTMASVISAVR